MNTYGVTLTVALIMGLEQIILAVIAIIVFINPLKMEKSELIFYSMLPDCRKKITNKQPS